MIFRDSKVYFSNYISEFVWKLVGRVMTHL